MHGDFDMAESFDDAMENVSDEVVDWLICPPIPYMADIANTLRGAQDCSASEFGAYTGEISAKMLDEIGCDFCIVGHSERRTMHGEMDETVKAKATQALNNNIAAIICVGETLEQRESGDEFKVVETQIRQSLPEGATAGNVVIAYEPVWAIGTGKAATSDDVLSMHKMIRELLKSILADGAQMRILYGGSVKPSNAGELLNLDNVDGALIGGASLKPDDFIAIGNAVTK